MGRESKTFVKIAARISPHFHARRTRLFKSVFSSIISAGNESTILDVGGASAYWKEFSSDAHITVVNLDKTWMGPPNRNCSCAVADGCALPFRADSFDVVFSNSVIEHLHSFENQQRFAREIQQCGRHLWVQTPAKYFPIEPHVQTLFIHYLPRPILRRLIRLFTIWGLMTQPDQQEVDELLAEVRLITYKDMRRLFPGCRIVRERFLLMTKSYIAVR